MPLLHFLLSKTSQEQKEHGPSKLELDLPDIFSILVYLCSAVKAMESILTAELLDPPFPNQALRNANPEFRPLLWCLIAL